MKKEKTTCPQFLTLLNRVLLQSRALRTALGAKPALQQIVEYMDTEKEEQVQDEKQRGRPGSQMLSETQLGGAGNTTELNRKESKDKEGRPHWPSQNGHEWRLQQVHMHRTRRDRAQQAKKTTGGADHLCTHYETQDSRITSFLDVLFLNLQNEWQETHCV